MGKQQFFDIKYPFSDDKDEYFFDMNKNYLEEAQSQILHLVFTPKGQKIRDPEFGTDLIKYLFTPNDDETESLIRSELNEAISKYVPNAWINDMKIFTDENEEHSKVVLIDQTVKKGLKEISNKVAIKL